MKIKTISFLLFISYNGFSQINLVPNPSFEDVVPNFVCPGSNVNNQQYFNFLQYWTFPTDIYWTQECSGPGTPDWYSVYCANNGYNECAIGFVPRTGSSWVAGAIRRGNDNYRSNFFEYMSVPLSQALIPSHKYYLEYYVKPFCQCSFNNDYPCVTGSHLPLNSFGATLSLSRPFQCAYDPLLPPVLMGPNSDVPYNTLPDGWVKISGFFLATANYSWLSIGGSPLSNWLGESRSFALDDVSLFDLGEIDENGCINNLNIENTNYYQQEPIFEVSNTITACYYADIPNNAGNVDVHSPANITYKAGVEVALKDNFGVAAGSTFHAFIAPCGNDCNPPLANVAQYVNILCDEECVQLGTPEINGMTYQWGAEPILALNYLSSSTIAQPIFCRPTGDFEVIKYTLTVTNACNQTDEATVYLTPDGLIDLSTGVTNFRKDTPPNNDYDWRLIKINNNNVNQPDYSCNPIFGWAISNYANWITPAYYPITFFPSDNFPDNGDYVYRINFSANTVLYDYTLKLKEIAADNLCEVYLNGLLPSDQLFTGPNNQMNQFVTYSTNNPALFINGNNTLYVRVLNGNNHTGFCTQAFLVPTCKPTQGFMKKSNNPNPSSPANNSAMVNNFTSENESNILTKPSEIIIHPNPTKGEFNISNTPFNSAIQITDMIGNIILEIKANDTGISTIDISKVSKGVYIVKVIEAGNAIAVKKLVKL